ncbi:MAG: WG repeat-containing protein [Polyangiaceae bacterium]
MSHPHARPAAALVLLALLALAGPAVSCSAAPGAAPLMATVPPATAAAGAPSAVTGARQAAAAEAMSCEPATFMDHPAGTRGLWAFEDPGSGLYGYRDQGGAVRIPPRFQFAYEFAPEGVTGAIDGGKPVFIDTTGKVLAEALLEDNGPDYFVAGLARIVEGGKIGFLSATGQVAIAPRLDGAGPSARAWPWPASAAAGAPSANTASMSVGAGVSSTARADGPSRRATTRPSRSPTGGQTWCRATCAWSSTVPAALCHGMEAAAGDSPSVIPARSARDIDATRPPILKDCATFRLRRSWSTGIPSTQRAARPPRGRAPKQTVQRMNRSET